MLQMLAALRQVHESATRVRIVFTAKYERNVIDYVKNTEM